MTEPHAGLPDLITLAARRGFLDESTARARLGPGFAAAARVAGSGLVDPARLGPVLAEYEALLAKTVPLSPAPPEVHCGRCGRAMSLRERALACDPCGVLIALAAPSQAPRGLPPEVEAASRNAANLLGRYVRLRELGRGGMGAVYLAYDPPLARSVALKVPKFDHPDDLARFRREAQLAAALNHPNIAQVYEVGEANGQMYLSMQLIEGKNAAEEEMTIPRAIAAVRDAARAVQYAHERGIIHRDLKPPNLMIDRTGRVFVLDFGLAKRQELGEAVTQSGILGTPAFMAPEQARGDPLDARADVYGLGATLYALATGLPPFQGKAAAEVIKRVLDEEPVRPRRLKPAIPVEVEVVIQKAMAKEPARRYASAGELADDLDRYLKGEPIRARPAAVAYRLRKRVARNPWAWVGMAGAILGGLAATAFVAARYVQARSELSKGDAAAAEQRWEDALAHFERSARLWGTAAGRGGARHARDELDRRKEAFDALQWGNRLARMYAAMLWDHAELWDEVEGVGYGAREVTEDRKAQLLARVEGALADARRAQEVEEAGGVLVVWARLMLGRGEPTHLDREVQRGLQSLKPDPMPLLLRARWRLKEYFERFELPALRAGGVEEEVGVPDWTESEEMKAGRLAAGEDMARIAGIPLAGESPLVAWFDRVRDGIAALLTAKTAQSAGEREKAQEEYLRAAERLAAAGRQQGAWLEVARLEGLAWLGAGEFEKAEEAWARVARAQRDWVEMYHWRGAAMWLYGAKEEREGRDGRQAFRRAVEHFTSALGLAPDNVRVSLGRASSRTLLGVALAVRGEDPSGEYEGAIEDCSGVLSRRPNLAEAHVGRGLARIRLGDAQAARGEDPLEEFMRAIEDLTRGISEDPSDVHAYRNCGMAWSSVGVALAERGKDPVESYMRAIEYFDRALSQDPDDAGAYIARGSARSSLGEALLEGGKDPEETFARAIEDYTRALTLAPADVLAQSNRGGARVNLGHALRARGEDPRQEYALAIEDYTDALSRNPGDALAQCGRGNAHKAQGDALSEQGMDPRQEYARAVEDYTGALARNPSLAGVQSNRGNVHESLGETLSRRGEDPRGEYALAIEDFTRAIAQNPAYASAYNNRGIAHANLGEAFSARGEDPREEHTRAIEDFSSALSRNPNDVAAYNNRGLARAHLADAREARGEDAREDYRDAIEDFSSALARNPNDAVSYANRGLAHAGQGDALAARGEDPREEYARAIEDFTEALARKPDYAPASNGRGNAHWSLAETIKARGEDPREEYARAVEDFTVALARNPNYGAAYVNRGNARHSLGRVLAARGEDPTQTFERAIQDYDAALARNPRLWQAHANKGSIYGTIGRWPEAVAAYEAAYGIAGDTAPALRRFLDEARRRAAEAISPDR